MRFLPVLFVACVMSSSAFAEGLECRRVSDPTPHLSCVEKPATAEAPTARPDSLGTPDTTTRRDNGATRDNGRSSTTRSR
jgi:hypothetical protein